MQAASFGRLAAPASQDAPRRRNPRAERVVWAGAMAVLTGTVLAGEAGGPAPYLVLDIGLGAVSVAVVPVLSRWPVMVALALSLLCAVSPAATPAATMAVLLVACWRPLPSGLLVAATGIAAHLIRGGWRPTAGLPYVWWAVLVCVAYAALVGWGTMVRANQALILSLRARAEQAEADQARRVTEARAAERARIAREMHDVLAHRLSLLATYAGALAYRPDAPPEQLSRAAEVVRSGAHQALEELREVIGVLRDDEMPDLTAGSRPLPGLAELPRLIEESQAAGMRIEAGGTAWDDSGLPDALSVPDGLGRTVYRAVQEGLTNVRKHAPEELARLRLDGRPGAGLDIVIANRLPGISRRPGAVVPGAGTGLIGLAERVELAGGRLEHRAADGEFRLHAWLPWPS
jgi:signal transduction histidine kinase